jgi:hypothetical protein
MSRDRVAQDQFVKKEAVNNVIPMDKSVAWNVPTWQRCL